MRTKIRASALLMLAGGLLPLFGGGCSSGNQAIQATSARATGRGAVQIKIHWPAIPQGRLIPIACQMIEVDLLNSDGSLGYGGSSLRPTSGNSSTISIPNVQAG